MFKNKQLRELFRTDLDSFFDTRLDDIFNYKKVAPITYKRKEWEKYQYTIEIDGTINTLDIFADNSDIACYPFNGNANDLSGNYNGTWSGTEQYDTGKFGQSASNTASNYISIDTTNLSSLNIVTVSLWFYHNSISSDYEDLLSGIGSNFYFKNGTINNGSGGDYYNYIDTYEAGVWNHLVIGFDTVNNKFLYSYLNGILQKSEYTTSDNVAIDNTTTIFCHNTIVYPFNGLIDQVRIFNRALTADEISQLYNEQVNTIKTITNYKRITLNGLNAKTKILTNYESNINNSKYKIINWYENNPNDVKYKIDIYKEQINNIKFRIAPYQNQLNYIFYRLAYDNPQPIRIIVKDLDDN